MKQVFENADKKMNKTIKRAYLGICRYPCRQG